MTISNALLCTTAALLLGASAHLTPLLAQETSTGQVGKLARAFLSSLDAEQKATTTFPLGDKERTNWHFVPAERRGLPIKAMSKEQRELAHGFLRTALSEAGYEKASNIMLLESVLAVLEDNPVRRDKEKYFVSIFGEPSQKGTWGWRFEGHHLSLNFTLVNGKTTFPTPSFLGANPGAVTGGPQDGLRALAAEEDLARALVLSLSEEQKATAILPGKAPRDILTKEQSEAVRPEGAETTGILVSAFDAAQKKAFWELVGEYVGRTNDAQAARDLARFKAVPEGEIRFAWVGSLKPSEPHYYRVNAGDLLIEYANTQNGAQHPHAVWRDLKNDFGRDALRDHLKQAHARIPIAN